MIIRMDERCYWLTKTRCWRHPKVGGRSLIHEGEATAGVNFDHKLITGLHDALQTFHLRQTVGESDRIDRPQGRYRRYSLLNLSSLTLQGHTSAHTPERTSTTLL